MSPTRARCCGLSTTSRALLLGAAIGVGAAGIVIGTSGPRDATATQSASVFTPGPTPRVVLREDRPEMRDPRFVLGYEMERIDGGLQDLHDFRGHVVLMVNVASECGLTRQYEGLERLYRELRDDGLVVLGFPANNFGNQEPGTNEQIAEFCRTNFGVTFPMFAKISVRGDDRHPLYERLAAQPEPIGGEPEWNFTKFLVDRDGRVTARFGPRVEPDDESMIEKIRELLAAG